MLAGPLLRRAEPDGLTFWLIASRVLELSLILESRQAGQQRRIRLEGEACQRLRLGHHAVLHLIRFTPERVALGYDRSPLEYRISRAAADGFRYQIDIS